jgi:hypothetical protein
MKIHYLNSSAPSKEDLARSLAGKRWERPGLSCILSCVELCRTFGFVSEGRTIYLLGEDAGHDKLYTMPARGGAAECDRSIVSIMSASALTSARVFSLGAVTSIWSNML